MQGEAERKAGKTDAVKDLWGDVRSSWDDVDIGSLPSRAKISSPVVAVAELQGQQDDAEVLAAANLAASTESAKALAEAGAAANAAFVSPEHTATVAAMQSADGLGSGTPSEPLIAPPPLRGTSILCLA